MAKKSIKIFVGYHKPYQLLESDILTPIHLGRSVAMQQSKDSKNTASDVEWLKKHMIGDDTSDNISVKNRQYCELTGIYWIWKHYDEIGNPDYLGFMHYRRHFIFNDQVFRDYTPTEKHERPYSKINVGNIYDGYKEHFGLDDKTIYNETIKYDVIIPESCDFTYLGVNSIREDYVKAIPGTHEKDLDVLVKAVKKNNPAYYNLLVERLNSPDKRCFQSFVLKKEIFLDYCSFLFDILSEVEKKIDVSKYSINGQRTIGYLGEILFDLYMYNLKLNENYKIKELGMTYLQQNTIPKPIKTRTAIVQLAYADYESLEISLANFCKYFDKSTQFFILQNGRGTYDTERTYRVAKRYEKLYPNNITVIDDIPPQKPYRALKQLFNSDRLAKFDYICKVDDDVFPVRSDWFDKLCSTYEKEFSRHGANLAYASALVNNNPFGFKQIIERNQALANEYYTSLARDHLAGIESPSKYYDGLHMVPANEIDDDVCGTIWQLPYISRWLHKKTTMIPDKYIEMTEEWPTVALRNKRYSINVMLFDKEYWNRIERNDCEYRDDDEFLSELYCKEYNKYVAVDLSNPFCHLFFFSQREENRDIIPSIRTVYEKRLNHPYPIALQTNKDIENENRLRDIDANANMRYSDLIASHHRRGIKTRIKNSKSINMIWRKLPVSARRKIKKSYSLMKKK